MSWVLFPQDFYYHRNMPTHYAYNHRPETFLLLKCFLSCIRISPCGYTTLSKKASTDNFKMLSTASYLQTVKVKPHCTFYFQKQCIAEWQINQNSLHTLGCISEVARFRHLTEVTVCFFLPFFFFLEYVKWGTPAHFVN